jgi:nitrite reductase/ring-hydroxylating ferredoxin subunit
MALSGTLQFHFGNSRDAFDSARARHYTRRRFGADDLRGDAAMAFVRAVAASEIPVGTIKEVNVAGTAVALANIGGDYHAINNTCLHRGGPLGEGMLEGKIVTCPWHGWQFDVTSGKSVQNPTAGVACYKTELRAGEVFVDLG